MRPRSINTRWRPAVAIALVAAVGPLSACGSSRPDRAQALISQTFAGGTRIHSGRLRMSLEVGRVGSGAAKHFSLEVRTAFQDNGAGAPDLDAAISIDNYGEQVRTGLTLVGGRVFITAGGHEYRASAAIGQAFRAGLTAGRGQGRGALALLGPLVEGARSWIAHPRLAGETSIGGVRVQRIEARVDLQKLLSATGSLNRTATAFLPAALVTAHIKDVRVQIFVGAHDHLLRRLSGTATLVGLGEPSSSPPGETALRATASIEISQPGVAQRIMAPTHPGPEAALERALRGFGGLQFIPPGSGGQPEGQSSGSSKPSPPSPSSSSASSSPSSSSSSSSLSTSSSSSSPSSLPG